MTGGSKLDTDVVPLGERAQRQVLNHVVAVGDEAESHYLEIKGALDLSKTVDVVKVAKFLLGAANRLPETATHHFQGHAVLVIRAEKGHATGVPRGLELHELEDRLRAYLGPQFPPYEFGRISVESDREVLFVIAQPPQDGQDIFVCHKDFQGQDHKDNLRDGAIYVRGSSNTRTAKAGDVLALVERARGGNKPPIELDVEILGAINRVDRVDEVMEQLYNSVEEKFTKPPEPAEETPYPAFLGAELLRRSRPLTTEDRAAHLETWRRDRAEHIERGREYLLGVVLPSCSIQVVSNRFVAEPHLVVTYHHCTIVPYRSAEDPDLDKVVEPVVQSSDHPLGVVPDLDDYLLTPVGHPVVWKQAGNNAEVTLTPRSFRPGMPWSTPEDDYVVVTNDPDAELVRVSWALTEEGSDDVSRGEFEVAPAAREDAGQLLFDVFLKA